MRTLYSRFLLCLYLLGRVFGRSQRPLFSCACTKSTFHFVEYTVKKLFTEIVGHSYWKRQFYHFSFLIIAPENPRPPADWRCDLEDPPRLGTEWSYKEFGNYATSHSIIYATIDGSYYITLRSYLPCFLVYTSYYILVCISVSGNDVFVTYLCLIKIDLKTLLRQGFCRK